MTTSPSDPFPFTLSMILKTVASLSAAIVNGTHRAAHRVGKNMVDAGLAITAAPVLKQAVSNLCGVRRRNPGTLSRTRTLSLTRTLTVTHHLTLILSQTLLRTQRASHSLPPRAQHWGCSGSSCPPQTKQNCKEDRESKATCPKNDGL